MTHAERNHRAADAPAPLGADRADEPDVPIGPAQLLIGVIRAALAIGATVATSRRVPDPRGLRPRVLREG